MKRMLFFLVTIASSLLMTIPNYLVDGRSIYSKWTKAQNIYIYIFILTNIPLIDFCLIRR